MKKRHHLSQGHFIAWMVSITGIVMLSFLSFLSITAMSHRLIAICFLCIVFSVAFSFMSNAQQVTHLDTSSMKKIFPKVINKDSIVQKSKNAPRNFYDTTVHTLKGKLSKMNPKHSVDQLGNILQKADSLIHFLRHYGEQSSERWIPDSLRRKNYGVQFKRDSTSSITDSIQRSANRYGTQAKQRISASLFQEKLDTNTLHEYKATLQTDTLIKGLTDPFSHLSLRKPWFRLTGGFVSYDFNYRSNIDTPFIEKDLSQHQLMVGANVLVGNLIPLRVNAYLRRSNSSYFPSINDVQVLFDPNAFRERFNTLAVQKLLYEVEQKKDSLLQRMASWKGLPTTELEGMFRQYFSSQKQIEAREIILVPQKAYDMSLPDSVNRQRANTAQQKAKQFLELYDKIQGEYTVVKTYLDSVQQTIQKGIEQCRRYEMLIKDYQQGKASPDQLQGILRQQTDFDVRVPDKYAWLMNVRNLALGRSSINSSELTTRNISLTGINFEYNSWYYVAVTAGMVDYRFRDFVVPGAKKTPQYLYQLRLGVGRLESNYFILTGFYGKKQVFTAVPGLSSMKVTGLSAESKWQISRNTYVIGEVAQSMSPDFHANPAVNSKVWNWSDKTNKAYSIKGFSYLPRTQTWIEGMYKYSGANYQSFNSFQTNSAMLSWYVKGDQAFFKRQLRITASIRANDFSNPYILQNYKANTIFKSISANFHKRGWPYLTVGYMPMSQLTVIDNQIAENRFQTLNASLSHFYAISGQRQSTSLVYTKFYNNSNDSSLLYSNASNFFLGHTIFFQKFNGTINVTHSKSPNYEFNVMEENFSIPFSSRGTVGFGVKINNLDRRVTKIGGFLNGSIRVNKTDILYLYFEHGYLPGTDHRLVSNLMGNVNFTKNF